MQSIWNWWMHYINWTKTIERQIVRKHAQMYGSAISSLMLHAAAEILVYSGYGPNRIPVLFPIKIDSAIEIFRLIFSRISGTYPS